MNYKRLVELPEAFLVGVAMGFSTIWLYEKAVCYNDELIDELFSRLEDCEKK